MITSSKIGFFFCKLHTSYVTSWPKTNRHHFTWGIPSASFKFIPYLKVEILGEGGAGGGGFAHCTLPVPHLVHYHCRKMVYARRVSKNRGKSKRVSSSKTNSMKKKFLKSKMFQQCLLIQRNFVQYGKNFKDSCLEKDSCWPLF